MWRDELVSAGRPRRIPFAPAALLFLLGGVAGCSMLSKKTLDEKVNPSVPGERFETIGVIAGGASRAELRMSAGVREDLLDAGFTAVRRSGRWADEGEALDDVCQAVDGVLFVYYDRLRLIECPDQILAYDVTGGEEMGVPGMTRLLIKYLRSRA